MTDRVTDEDIDDWARHAARLGGVDFQCALAELDAERARIDAAQAEHADAVYDRQVSRKEWRVFALHEVPEGDSE